MKRSGLVGQFLIKLAVLGLTQSNAYSAENIGSAYAPPVFGNPDRRFDVAETENDVRAMFDQFAERLNLPGLVYAVVLDDEIVYSGGYGYANLSGSNSVSNQTLFRVASMSKAITAQAILQLRDANKLSLEDQVSTYIPEIGELSSLTTDAAQITIRHLLTHTAGFPEDNAWADRQLAMPDMDFTRLIENGIQFSTVTGQEYEYSNVGYSLLGRIIEVVSEQSFEEYTTENILRPLQMNSTIWEHEQADPAFLATGYSLENGNFIEEPMEHHGAFGPMAGLITSIDDFAKYAALHLSAWPARNEADNGPLQRSSLRQMHQPHRITTFVSSGSCPFVLAYSYGLNWAQECDTPPYMTHNGGLPGFGSNWLMVPDYGLAIIAFTNRTYVAPLFLNVEVMQFIIRQANLEPRAPRSSSILEQRKREVTRILIGTSGFENSNIFANNFFLDNDVVSLSEQTRALVGQIGPVRVVTELQPQNQLRGTFTLEGESSELEVFFSLTPESIPLIQVLEFELSEQ